MKNASVKTQDVQITSVYLQKDGNQVVFTSLPRQLIYQGRKYVLAEA